MSNGPFLYPNVTSIPAQGQPGAAAEPKKQPGTKSEFDQVFESRLPQGNSGIAAQPGAGAAGGGLTTDLQTLKEPLKFSAHATQRLAERKIKLDPATLTKVNDALDKAAAKGVEDTLVLTDQAALIVSVKNRTVITAMDKGSMSGNIFTNIDGAVIV